MKYLPFVLVILICYSCKPSPPKIESDEEFLSWLSGKEFTSIGNDETHYYSDGSLGSPEFPLVIQFDGDKVKYQGCTPTGYDFYRTSDGYSVSFTPDCTKGDNIELHFYFEGETYKVSSYMYNSERASHTGGSAIAQLDALVNEEIADGPFMTITKENIKIAGSKPKLVSDVGINNIISTDTLAMDTIAHDVIIANAKKEYGSLDFTTLKIDTMPYIEREHCYKVVYSKEDGEVAMIKLLSDGYDDPRLMNPTDISEYYYRNNQCYYIKFIRYQGSPKEEEFYIREGQFLTTRIADGKVIFDGDDFVYSEQTAPYNFLNEYRSLFHD